MWSKAFHALFVDYVMIELSWTLNYKIKILRKSLKNMLRIFWKKKKNFKEYFTNFLKKSLKNMRRIISKIFYKNLWKNVCLKILENVISKNF